MINRGYYIIPIFKAEVLAPPHTPLVDWSLSTCYDNKHYESLIAVPLCLHVRLVRTSDSAIIQLQRSVHAKTDPGFILAIL